MIARLYFKIIKNKYPTLNKKTCKNKGVNQSKFFFLLYLFGTYRKKE